MVKKVLSYEQEARVARERCKPEGAICSGKKVLSYEQERCSRKGRLENQSTNLESQIRSHHEMLLADANERLVGCASRTALDLPGASVLTQLMT
jgi:hypothetical protein